MYIVKSEVQITERIHIVDFPYRSVLCIQRQTTVDQTVDQIQDLLHKTSFHAQNCIPHLQCLTKRLSMATFTAIRILPFQCSCPRQ